MEPLIEIEVESPGGCLDSEVPDLCPPSKIKLSVKSFEEQEHFLQWDLKMNRALESPMEYADTGRSRLLQVGFFLYRDADWLH